MRIGVISDTHIPDRAKEIPQTILEDFKNVDMIIHSGDLVELEVIEKLNTLCKSVKAVYGNMDPPEVRRTFLEKEIIQIGNYRVGIMHGNGVPFRLIELMKQSFRNDAVDLIIFGHSHSPLCQKIGNILFFNPGSPTDKIFSPYNSYGIIEINEKIEAKIVRV